MWCACQCVTCEPGFQGNVCVACVWAGRCVLKSVRAFLTVWTPGQLHFDGIAVVLWEVGRCSVVLILTTRELCCFSGLVWGRGFDSHQVHGRHLKKVVGHLSLLFRRILPCKEEAVLQLVEILRRTD